MSTDVDSTTAVTMAARAIAHHPCEIPAVMRSEKQPTSTLPDVTVEKCSRSATVRRATSAVILSPGFTVVLMSARHARSELGYSEV